MFAPGQNQSQSLLELVGRNAQEAASYISVQGITNISIVYGITDQFLLIRLCILIFSSKNVPLVNPI